MAKSTLDLAKYVKNVVRQDETMRIGIKAKYEYHHKNHMA
jgi:hypothetical protein